ncbi:phosphatase PAP2 family protein (plasmid) [Peteryoungia desertarenae]|uniref:Phosphatase PAP2 family protein n=1 Tax=Peteryoungia desertarenae TaxID=1813451 RepID=A0ABX6QT38_9HYPH|nr:phosphatase PAP2 family protein [Peteryoungia desertarenae]QLF71482.1 phosphatase PAP2 family protein [Peteryoungia desertarenae]
MIKRYITFLGDREWTLVLALLVVAAALWGFVELVDEVIEGETGAVDEALLLAFRSAEDPAVPLGPDWLKEMMRDFTALGGVGILTLLTFAVAGYVTLLGKPKAALAILISVGGGVIISTLIKAGIDRPRPDLVPHGSYVSSASFPSGHSMMATVVYLTLAVIVARVRPRWRQRVYVLSWAILATLLVGVSRIYLGVHWPSDVLAGWTVGSAWAILCWTIMIHLQRRRQIEGESS